MKLKIILIGLIAFGFATSAMAGSVADDDGDLVPNIFDNCTQTANGTGVTGQTDADNDGYGNVCDGDLTNDGVVAGTDFGAWAALFGLPLGPSGLACAGTIDAMSGAVPCF